MQLVDIDRSKRVLNFLEHHQKTQSAGGSAANTIHGLAKLGASTGYIGVIGEDELGGHFVRDLINAGVDPHLIHSDQETGRAIALVTPDSERTFATFLGAAIELSAIHLSNPGPETTSPDLTVKQIGDVFKNYSYFHIEGYLVQNHQLIETALKIAKENNLVISLDLASYNVVEANREFLQAMIRDYVNIVFANEEEAKALTGKEPMEALHELAEYCDIAVVKTGAKGSLIMKGDEVIEIGIIKVIPVDTTGAGDLYAAGFLFGLSNGFSLEACGKTGALLAGNVIEVLGAKMDDSRWAKMKSRIRE